MTVMEASPAVRRNRSFITKAMDAPMLEREHEFELARRWRDDGDEAALHEMVSSYMRLVVSIAAKFRTYGLPMSDLIQEGHIGLMQAASRFEPEREVRFSTYAGWWIRSAIQEYVLRNWSIVRTGTSATQKTLFFNLRWMRSRIDGAGSGSMPAETRDRIARDLKVKGRDVTAMAERLSGRDQSLHQSVGEEGGDELESFLPDDGPSPEEIVLDQRELATRRKWLVAAMTELTDREQFIIRERRLNEDKATLEELGGVLGITKERVRQIEHKAFEKLSNAVVRRSAICAPAAIQIA